MSSDPPSPPPPPASASLTSLDILNPRQWRESRKRAWTSETAQHIQDISREALVAASARDWNSPAIQNYIVPSQYCAEFEHADGVPLTKWDDYVIHHERLATANPEYCFDVLDAVANVFEKLGTAECFMLLRVIGHPANSVRESVIVLYWKQVEDQWRCLGQRVVRGMFWNA